ncbi:MAG: AI-2E family transporter [Pseudomonadales bacterium]|nr:AI-2E family transporter [Pseudomonadales bacterium]
MRLVNFTLVAALVVLSFYLLIAGRELLLPLVIAFVFWFLINLLAKAFSQPAVAGKHLPRWVCYVLSIFCFIGMVWALVGLVSMNIDELVRVAPLYQAKLEARGDSLLQYFGMEAIPSLSQLGDIVNLGDIITRLASSITNVAAQSGIILIYLGFLLLEQADFDKKLAVLIKDPQKEKDVRRLIRRIDKDVRKYIGIKMVTSGLTGILSYIVLEMIGVNFSEFWAILIFLLNFIPTIGSIIATIFPALITLVQFDNLTPFILVITVVTAIQFSIGNILEPKMMGSSLNLSPMIILLNLSLWGMIWGVPGMFLCVPVLVIGMIVFSHLPQTRAIAVLLSRDGQISTLSDD